MLSPSFTRLLASFSRHFFYASLSALLCVSALATESTNKHPLTKLAPSGTQFVLISDPWNLADTLGHGFCSYKFLLGAYEWTVRDWKEKVLDLVACKVDVNNENPALQIADPHGLWNEKMARWITRTKTDSGEYVYSIAHPGVDEYLPITNVNLFDAFRACNIRQRFMEYGSSFGLEEGESFDEVTERGGAYIITIHDGKQEAQRAVGCRFYIPTQDEWIKAAYYTPHYNPNKIGDTNAPAGYCLYPTQYDDPNPRDRESNCLGNKANYVACPSYPFYPFYPFCFGPLPQLAAVNYCGWFDDQWNPQGTRSHYGCFDLAGNVNEWTTTSIETTEEYRTISDSLETITPEYKGLYRLNGDTYIVRGGYYGTHYSTLFDNALMRTCVPWSVDPTKRSDFIGFRMAAVEGTITPLGKDFSEAGILNPWDALSTTEQEVVDALIFVGVGEVGGFVFSKVTGWIGEKVIGGAIARAGKVKLNIGSVIAEDDSSVISEEFDLDTERLIPGESTSSSASSPSIMNNNIPIKYNDYSLHGEDEGNAITTMNEKDPTVSRTTSTDDLPESANNNKPNDTALSREELLEFNSFNRGVSELQGDLNDSSKSQVLLNKRASELEKQFLEIQEKFCEKLTFEQQEELEKQLKELQFLKKQIQDRAPTRASTRASTRENSKEKISSSNNNE